MILGKQKILNFRRKLLRFYAKHGRDLPWRQTTDPYCITVSELMLQQTQVERVIPKYLAWIKRWPDWNSLAKASNRDLLGEWSGLGYNRRAIYLGEMARTIVRDHNGVMPKEISTLEQLPGIGRYTARAILIFSFNAPVAAIDTNIRKVILAEFGLRNSTPLDQLESIATALLPRGRSRDWHNALMDYGSLVQPKVPEKIDNGKRQTPFAGSNRQIRGEIIRQLTERSRVTISSVAGQLKRSLYDVHLAAMSLDREGIIKLRGITMRLQERGSA